MNRERAISSLSKGWSESGLSAGDTVLIHSSMRRTLEQAAKHGTALKVEHVVESLIDCVGAEGTLLFPLFNFDFTRGVKFDVASTQSQMGALTETARKWSGAVRTGHPIYSFAALGKGAETFKGVNNFSGYGADSPFGILHGANGKIAIIDLPDQNSMTFYHYIEESLSVEYRYHKTFTGSYVDANRQETTKTFGLFVRNTELGVITKVNPMGERLWSSGHYKGYRPNVGTGMRVIDAQCLFSETKTIIEAGEARGVLYDIEE
jgi:aminoglycoside 3-N-acetyltransferase